MSSPRYIVALTATERRTLQELVQSAPRSTHRLPRWQANLINKLQEAPLSDVTVCLTLTEAKAADYALGNTTESPDAMEAVFTSSARRLAAHRGQRKLTDAIYRRRGK